VETLRGNHYFACRYHLNGSSAWEGNEMTIESDGPHGVETDGGCYFACCYPSEWQVWPWEIEMRWLIESAYLAGCEKLIGVVIFACLLSSEWQVQCEKEMRRLIESALPHCGVDCIGAEVASLLQSLSICTCKWPEKKWTTDLEKCILVGHKPCRRRTALQVAAWIWDRLGIYKMRENAMR